VFVDPRPADGVLVSRLDEFAPDTAADTPAALDAMVAAERWKLDIVEPVVPSGRLLDVGCGNGAFVAAAARAGYDAEGHDLAPEVAAAASARWSLPVHTGDLGALEAGPYDVVTLWDTLEHAVAPRALLVEVARLLAPGGHVVVLSPHSAGVSARVLHGRWWAFGPNDHLVLFSGDALADALRDAGLMPDVVTTRQLSPPYPPEDADPRRPLMRVYGVVARRDALQHWLASRGLGDWILAIAQSVPERVSS
jgi:SAM-dependent methyltransferase